MDENVSIQQPYYRSDAMPERAGGIGKRLGARIRQTVRVVMTGQFRHLLMKEMLLATTSLLLMNAAFFQTAPLTTSLAAWT
jgi:hypothetical protein